MPDDAQDKLLLVEQDIFERDLILDELRRIFQLATTDKIQFLSRASDLTNHQRKFDKVQSKIEKTLIKAKLFEKEDHIKMRNDFSDLYYAIISHVNSYKSADEQNRRLSRVCNAHEVTSHRNLPILPLPEFNGDPTNWPSFFDLFCSLIHNNSAYTKTEKLRYLLLSVKNEPYDLIKSIPITEENYLLALTTLKSRYENRRIIASKHLDRILDLEICSDRVGQSVRNLLNIYLENIRALEAMDFPVNEWSFIILNILLRKISPGLRKNYERSLSRPSEIPHISTLIEFLEREISAEEITNSTISNKQPIKNYYSNSPTTRKQIGGKPSRAYVASMAAVASRSRPSSPRNKDRFCLKCSGQHTLPKCSEFLNLSPQDRHTFVKNKSICWNCLNVGHDLKNCKSNFVCRVCHKRHHSLLHLNLSQSFSAVNDTENNIGVSLPLTEGERKDDAIHNNCATNSQTTRSMNTVLLSTAVIDIYFNNNKISTVRCIVDSGSQASFITEACVQRLGLPRRQINIPIFGIGDTVPLQPKGMVTCAITPRDKQQPFIPVDALILPSLMSKIPSVSLPFSEWPHIRGLSLADPDFHKSQPVDMLLGADILSQILLNNTIAGPPGTPIAIDSVFGYLLCGKLTCNVSVSTPLQVCFSSFDNDNLQRFWELESVSEERSYTPDEEYCESFFQQTYTRDHTGRYIVALPFKVNAPPLGESRQIAVARFNKLEYRLEHNPQLKVDYHSCLQEYLDLEHMEPCVDRPLSGASYYIPHHCVIKPTSETTRTRVVFDAGCRSTSGFSLNDLLLSGPKLHLDIVDVLLKFRVHAVALCCDIRQMYRNILVREEDRNFQRLLWRRSPEEPLRDYRLRTVTFGINCSPYLALRTIRQLAYDEADRFPLASSILLNDVFVDDVVSGSNTQANALALQQELIGICDAAGFSLRKWQSNEPALLAAVQSPDLHGGRQENVPFAEMENDTGVKVLGLQWNPKSDCFNFKVQVTSHKCTKRTILSEVAKIYDPLGLLAPVIFFAKHLIQLLWSANISWDEQPPTNVVHSWTCFTNELSLLSQAKFSRYIFDTNDINSIQIHGFADASQIGYGACVYIRHSGRYGEIKTYLIVAKTRVAPLRTPLTIPRLELLAALLLSKLLERVIHTYGDRINVDQLYAWSDSSIVLAWLRSSPHEWKTFVSNRVSSIISRVPAESWHHVPSADNPADPASRGLLPGALIRDEQWFCGPAWLRLDASSWPIQGHNVDTNEERTDLELDGVSKPPPQPPPEKRKYVVHADKEEYDFAAHRSIAKPTNTFESTGHLIKGCLGGGILGIHEAYMKCGLWTSLVVTIIFGFYISYCVHILVKSAQILYKRLHLPEMSYPDLAEASLEVGPFPKLRKYSKWFRYAVDLIICIDLFGACCVYQIIIAKTIKEVIEYSEGLPTGDIDQLRLYVLTLLLPILVLCMITTLKYLAPFSLIADVFIVVCVVATVYYGLQTAPAISTVPAFKDAVGFFEFSGIVIFSMEGIGVSLPIENNMREPKKFPLVLCAGMSVVVSFLILVGFFGYWGFGEQSTSPVTLNFPSEIFPTILKLLMGVMIFITYALNFWAPFNLVWHYMSGWHDVKKHWLWERVYRAISVIIITSIAIAFPNIGNLMGLLGAFCLSNMGFIFPACIDLLVVWESPGLGRFKWRLWKNVAVIVVGVLLFFAGTYSNAKGLIANL